MVSLTGKQKITTNTKKTKKKRKETLGLPTSFMKVLKYDFFKA